MEDHNNYQPSQLPASRWVVLVALHFPASSFASTICRHIGQRMGSTNVWQFDTRVHFVHDTLSMEVVINYPINN